MSGDKIEPRTYWRTAAHMQPARAFFALEIEYYPFIKDRPDANVILLEWGQEEPTLTTYEEFTKQVEKGLLNRFTPKL